MKYLRGFNESIHTSDFTKEILEFSTDNLSYLMDDGFTINVENSYRSNKTNAFILIKNDSTFNFKDIEDDFIPYYEILISKYDIYRSGIELKVGKHDFTFVSSDDVYNCDVKNILAIYIEVTNKK